MSSTLGTGSVALTPINLDTVPPAYEGSKAGLLTLNWALVKASNAGRYAQPLNLLQAYWTGQFTTPQAVLIDNAAVGYPVRLTSQSTGQRVTCPAHGQIMSPLLVSSAPAFLFELLLPPGLVQPVDQVTTRLFFLNTPQTPFQIAGSSNPVTAQVSQSFSVALPAVASGASIGTVTLVAPFTQGTQSLGYVSFTALVIPPLQFSNGATPVATNTIVSLLDGAATFWQNAQNPHAGNAPGGSNANYNIAVAFPAGLLNTDGLATLLQVSVTNTNPAGALLASTVSLNVTFYYTVTVAPS